MTLEASDVQIIFDDSVDITNKCLVTAAKFTSNSSAQPGTAEVTMRDPDRDLVLPSGRRLKLLVDGRPLWAGFSTVVGRGSFFPAGDGKEQTKARKWILRGVDNNILLDKRFLRYPTNYLSHAPFITTDTFDGQILKDALADLFDMPSWLDITTFIDDVKVPASAADGHLSTANPWAYPQQGTKLRQTFDDLAQFSAAVFYIGPDDAVHYHAVQDRESPWGFSDRPNFGAITQENGFEGVYHGFREFTGDEDGSGIVTDALVWGGSEFAGAGGTVFARATDPDLEDLHSKWQHAETHFGETSFKTQTGVDIRANMIVFGNADGDPSGAEPGSVSGEGPRGLRFPQWAYNFAWHTRNVPLLSGSPRHIFPGDLVSIQLWAYSQDEGVTPFTKLLPLRSLALSFPSGARDGKAIVRFDGGFDLRNEDSKFLWAYLRRRERQVRNSQLAVVTNDSTTSPYGGLGQFVPDPVPDGVETVFTLPFGYIPGTTNVYINGLLQRLDTDYTESDPDAGEITFDDPPFTTDSLYVTCRTLPA